LIKSIYLLVERSAYFILDLSLHEQFRAQGRDLGRCSLQIPLWAWGGDPTPDVSADISLSRSFVPHIRSLNFVSLVKRLCFLCFLFEKMGEVRGAYWESVF
jgi:hypothetical protein